MSDPFDKDPDDVLEPDNSASRYGEDTLEPDNPASLYEEGKFDTAPDPPEPPGSDTAIEADYSDVDPEVRKLFWKLVLGIKFALLALTLGALFVVFGENTTLGGQLLAFGLLLTGYVAYQYRESKSRLDSGDDEVDETEETGDGNEGDEGNKSEDGERGKSDEQGTNNPEKPREER